MVIASLTNLMAIAGQRSTHAAQLVHVLTSMLTIKAPLIVLYNFFNVMPTTNSALSKKQKVLSPPFAKKGCAFTLRSQIGETNSRIQDILRIN
jgi:hypothetical protein